MNATHALIALLLLASTTSCAAATDARPAPRARASHAAPSQPDLRVDYGCSVDADCAVKDVGNCCGYYPACVGKDSSVFPERVKAECAKQGRASICGFRQISACKCVERHCEAVDSPAGDVR